MKRGHVTIVQYSANLDGSAISALLLAKGFKKDNWQVSIVFGHEGEAIGEFEKLSCKTIIFPHKNWLRRSGNLHTIKDWSKECLTSFQFTRVYKTLKPDVVYVNTLVSLAAVLAAKICKIKTIWHLREMFQEVEGELKTSQWCRPIIKSIVSKLPDRVIGNSERVAQNILKNFSKDAIIVPNAVDNSFFLEGVSQDSARISLRLPIDHFIIGIPGNLRPVKGHLFFLTAISEILKKNSYWTIVITGKGKEKYEKDILHFLNKFGIAPNVKLIGLVNNMSVFYKACDIVCVPSKSETFGRTIIESFASKVPVIATRVGGIPEIIRHKENGLLINYGNKKDLIKAITYLIDKPKEKERIVRAAYKHAVELYAENIYQKRLVELTANLL